MHGLLKRDGSLESMEDTTPPSKIDEAARTLSPTAVQDLTGQHGGDSKAFSVVGWIKHLVDSEQRNSSQKDAFRTPVKSSSQSSFADNTTTPPKHPLSSPDKMPHNSSFRKQSEAVGAGWNAKGLQKATKGDWEGALECFETALSIRTQVLGDNHRDVANTRNNMGIALGRLGREEEAMVHLEQALETRTHLHGTEHQDVAATLHNMANVKQQRGDYEGALENFYEAKRIQEHLLGDCSIQVARAWNAIGHVLFDKKDLEKARDAYRHALDTFIKAGRDEAQDVEVQHTKLDLEEVEQLLC